METLTNLQTLRLDENRIKEITGLEHLTNLQKLDLRSNKIEEISGLETLTNFRKQDLWDNPIRADERDFVFIIEEIKEDVPYSEKCFVYMRNAQEIVKYCQEKVKK